jgi:hypothetical protein
MHNWMMDYHHALLIRLAGLVVLFCALSAFRLLARHVWQTTSSLMQRLPQGASICRHQKP